MSSPRRNPEPARRSSTNDRDRGRNDKATAGPGGGGSADAEGEDRIGPYRIREEVGRGSFATVFRGTSVDTKDSVAIKAVIRSKLTTKLLENLESEISILKRITHRNIVELKDCLKTSSHIYLIMAFCSAGDLSLYIRKRGDLVALTASNQGLLPDPIKSKEAELRPVLYPHPKDGGLNETIVRCFLGQLVDALRFLRTQNVIHRDIKPQNLLLQPASASDLAAGHPPGIPVLKVADFGFARWLPSQSLAETLCGSPLYMAPEILRYEKYDAKADLWSVGAVLFEMSVGKPPFRAQNHVDLLRKIERGEDKIKFPDEKKHDETTDKVPTRVAPDLKALIRALLKRNPGERMSFDDFFRDASRVATGGTAVGLMLAESVSAEYARIASLSNVITTSRTPSSSTPPPPLNPPPPPIPSYIDQEPPPFARRPSQATPPLPAPSPASGSGSSRTSSFAPKYVVAGSGSNAADADIKVRDFVVPRASTSNDVPVNRVGSAMDRLADQTREADSMTESSDSVLGRDYVVVEKRTVEINALADELANAPKQSNLVVQRTGRGFLSRPLSSLGTTPPTTLAPVAPYPPVLSPYDSNTTPPFAIPAQRQVSAPHPYSLASSPRPPSFLSSSPRSATFIERFPGSPLALVGSPTAAIAKGLLNMASLKIFGSPTDGILLRRASTRKPISRSTPVVDPEEDKLMSELEEIAQKALVIFDFADSKIIHILPPTPQTSSSTSLGTPSYFSHLAAREQASMNPFSPIPTSSSPMRRTSSSSSERPFGIPPSTVKAEVIAAESMVLYLKSLAFLGKGIEKARKFWNGRKTDQLPSPDFNEAVQWFRQRFNECFDKAEFAKSRSLDSIPSSALTSKLIYDRALEISRASALLELSNTSPADCETAYETALWMLYSILDPLLDDGDGAMDETDRGTVERFVASVEGRLKALRKK